MILFLAFSLFTSYEEGFDPYPCDLSGDGKVYKWLYESYADEVQIEEEYIIPPLIHFIWLGSPLPPFCQTLIDTWSEHHPTWKIILWTDRDIESFGLQNKEAYEKAKNYGEKSDIFRYEILYRYGGLYVDTDFECLKPFDELHKSCDFYAGMNHAPVELLIGIIGSRPGHPIMKACIDRLRAGTGDHSLWRILDATGPHHFTNTFLSEVQGGIFDRVVPFPPAYFYPMPNTVQLSGNRETLKTQYVKPESMAIHWWSVSWQNNLPE